MNQRGGELTTQMLDIYLLTMHQETLDIVPNIAAGYAVSDDGLTVPLELRPGSRWSNGDPFIVDDWPTTATIHSTARFYKPEWLWLWAEHEPEQAGRLLDEVGLTGRDRDGFRTFPDGSNLTIQVAARTGGPVDISKLFELEIAQWAEVDLRVVPRLVDDAAWGENQDADEFMLQPGGIDAITEFWNWINDGPGSAGVGLHGDFNMTGSYDEWEQGAPADRARRTQAVRLRRRVARHRAARGVETLLRLAAPVPDRRDQLSLSEFGSGEWFELAQKMFDFTGENVFMIGTVGDAPNILLTNNDLRNARPDRRAHRRTGGPVDIRKLFELEIAQWAEVDLHIAPRLVDDAACGENGAGGAGGWTAHRDSATLPLLVLHACSAERATYLRTTQDPDG